MTYPDAATVASPCISVCRIAPGTGHCLGCFRTRDEIRAWRDAGNDERKAILARAAARRENVKTPR